MTEDPQRRRSSMSVGVRIIFCLSLALNLLIVGAIAGHFLRPGVPSRDLDPRSNIGRVLYQALPRADQRAMRQQLRQRVDRATLRQTRIGPALDQALRADPFDVDAVRDLMTRQAAALQTGQNAMRDGWLEILDRMSPAERAAYADRLREGLKKNQPLHLPD